LGANLRPAKYCRVIFLAYAIIDRWRLVRAPKSLPRSAKAKAARAPAVQHGGTDHFKLTTRSGAVRKPADRARLARRLSAFWHKLVSAAHSAGADAVEMTDPVTDLCIMLSGCVLWLK
jgi:hypothetical protein